MAKMRFFALVRNLYFIYKKDFYILENFINLICFESQKLKLFSGKLRNQKSSIFLSLELPKNGRFFIPVFDDRNDVFDFLNFI
jgi:hypothetical protein